MENPRATVTVSQVVDALVKMRAMLAHRMKSPDIAPVVYNEIRDKVRAIDEQLSRQQYGGLLEAVPQRVWSRAQRQKHKGKAGNKFTDRVNARFGNVVRTK